MPGGEARRVHVPRRDERDSHGQLVETAELERQVDVTDQSFAEPRRAEKGATVLAAGRWASMPSRLRLHPLQRALVGAALIFVAPACALPKDYYVEPPAHAPHAIVLVSTTLSSQPGENLDQNVAVDGLRLELTVGKLEQPTSALRVMPGTKQWVIESRFHHAETRYRLESVEKTEREYKSCATRDSRGNCEGGYVEVTHRVMENVPHLETVEDASCRLSRSYTLVGARTYRLAYTFVSHGRCEASLVDVTDATSDATTAGPARPVVTPTGTLASPLLPSRSAVWPGY